MIDDYTRFPQATHRAEWTAPRTGVVAAIDAEAMGRAAVVLGAGRDRVDADVDPSAGIEIRACVGEPVRSGEAVVIVSARDASRVEAARRAVAEAVRIAECVESPARPLIIATMTRQPVVGGRVS